MWGRNSRAVDPPASFQWEHNFQQLHWTWSWCLLSKESCVQAGPAECSKLNAGSGTKLPPPPPLLNPRTEIMLFGDARAGKWEVKVGRNPQPGWSDSLFKDSAFFSLTSASQLLLVLSWRENTSCVKWQFLWQQQVQEVIENWKWTLLQVIISGWEMEMWFSDKQQFSDLDSLWESYSRALPSCHSSREHRWKQEGDFSGNVRSFSTLKKPQINSCSIFSEMQRLRLPTPLP